MNLADLAGYTVGGTVHIIANNLLGFTTLWNEEHSSRFAAQLALRQSIPIFHVNGEDVDAVVRVGRMALDYRYTFGSDVVVDLIGYRRHGHSEVDDPTVTQPLLYKSIKNHPPLWEIYAQDTGIENAQERVTEIRSEFEAAQKRASSITKKPTLRELPSYWNEYKGGRYKPEYEVDTGLPAEELTQLNEKLTTYPETFHIHPKVRKLLEQRAEMGVDKRPVDYGMAEALAFASVVKQGIPVRLSGQDTRRGTFNIFTLPLDGPATPSALFGSRFNENDPRTWPAHTNGAAVDLTLRDSVTRQLLDMGANFEDDSDSAASAGDYFERELTDGRIDENDVRLQNRRLLNWAMTREGLLNETAKVFWHYDWGNQIYVRASRAFLPDPPKAAWYGYIESPGERTRRADAAKAK